VKQSSAPEDTKISHLENVILEKSNFLGKNYFFLIIVAVQNFIKVN